MRTTTDVVRQSSAKIAIILVLLSTYCIDRSGENSLEKKDSQILIQQVNGGRFTLARVTSTHPITNERGFLPPTSVSPVVLI